MTNRQVLEIAMKQSAIESCCDWQDFNCQENKVVISRQDKDARKYLKLPFICDLTSYGTNIVASVSEGLEGIVKDYINRFPIEHCFETPNLHYLMERIRPSGYDVCFMAEYFLPDADRLLKDGLVRKLHDQCPYEIRIIEPDGFKELYTEQWGNALCKERKELDILGAGAYDGETLVGLAGASADCKNMWQIGIDVLPGYRRQKIASTLTSRLAVEILNRDIVPFYCCAWSNIGSARNAAASGFRQAWVQVTVKEIEEIAEMNRA